MGLYGVGNGFNLYQAVADRRMNQQKDKAEMPNKAAEKNNAGVYGKGVHYANTNKADIDSISRTSQKVELSDKAKAYLEELRKKYSNMDIMVANYGSDEEAQRYLSRGAGEYNVLIDTETLEKMASDESERVKYEGILDNAGTSLKQVKQDLGSDADYVKSIGISIDKDGNTKYFSMIDESLVRRDAVSSKEKNEHEAGWHDRRSKKITVSADNLEELMKKVRESIEAAKEDAVKNQTGTNFDVKL